MTTPPAAPVRNILGIVGSLRRGSYNRMLLHHAAAVAPPRLKIEVADGLIDLPLFNEDLEEGGPPPSVAAVKDAIRAADGLIIASPEYNFGIPGTVKNFVDWVSRPPRRGAFVDKPIALIGASTGRTGGTVQCQGQLRVTLAVLGAHVLPSPPVLVGEAGDRFGPDGELLDELARQVVGIALDRFLTLVDTLAGDGAIGPGATGSGAAR